MAELTTLARPYAKAAFDNAKAGDSLVEWSEALVYAAEVLAIKDMRQILAHPGLTETNKVELLCDCYKKPVSEGLKNFFSVLAENNRLALLPEISALFKTYYADLERTVDIELSTPFELTDEQQKKLAKALSSRLERQVTLATSMDQSLIGGVLIRAGDMVIDASVRGKLSKLAKALGS